MRFHDCRATGPFDDTTPSGTTSEPEATQVLLPKSVLGATRDLADFVCGRSGQKLDVPLSTVAILSARFPYVSPSGRVDRRCPDDDQGNKVTYVVDGGYLETSGASPLVELEDKLEPMIRAHNRRADPGTCVIPFMIQIDNGYEDDAAATRQHGRQKPRFLRRQFWQSAALAPRVRRRSRRCSLTGHIAARSSTASYSRTDTHTS